MLARCRWRFLS